MHYNVQSARENVRVSTMVHSADVQTGTDVSTWCGTAQNIVSVLTVLGNIPCCFRNTTDN